MVDAATKTLDALFTRLVALYGQGHNGIKAGKLHEGKVAAKLRRDGVDDADVLVRQVMLRAWEAAGGTATSRPPKRA